MRLRQALGGLANAEIAVFREVRKPSALKSSSR